MENKKLKRSDFYETRTKIIAFKYEVLEKTADGIKSLGIISTTEKLNSKKKELEALTESGFSRNCILIEAGVESKLYGILTEEQYMSVAVEIEE